MPCVKIAGFKSTGRIPWAWHTVQKKQSGFFERVKLIDCKPFSIKQHRYQMAKKFIDHTHTNKTKSL